MSKTKKLVIIRHAHRSKLLGKEADNGLSEKGFEQAEALGAHFKSVFKGSKAVLVTSPKKRCRETIAPIARDTKQAVAVSDLLDEGGAIRQKALRFHAWVEEQEADLILACSHGDVIPELIDVLTGKSVDLDKGAWAEVVLEEGEPPRLGEVIQEFTE